MEPPVVNVVDNEAPIKKPKRKRKSNLWDDETHAAFLDLCIDEERKGNKPGSHFNKNGFDNLIKNLKEQRDKTFDTKQLKNHWEHMRREWKLFDCLMRIESGIGWDPTRKTIDATPEWWAEKIKADPDLAVFRDQNLDQYKLYYEPLFRDSIAVGDRTRTPSSFANISTDAFDLEGSGDSDEVNPVENVVPLFPECGSSVMKKKGKGKGKSKAAAFDEKLDSVLQAISSRSTQTFPPQSSSKACMDIVKGYPGFETGSNGYFDALTVLVNKEIRDMFMVSESNDLKMQWLSCMIESKKKDGSL